MLTTSRTAAMAKTNRHTQGRRLCVFVSSRARGVCCNSCYLCTRADGKRQRKYMTDETMGGKSGSEAGGDEKRHAGKERQGG